MTTQKSGLIVKGRTPADNHKLDLVFLSSGLYAEWNAVEGWFFLPEDESMYDQLEEEIQEELRGREIYFRIESI